MMMYVSRELFLRRENCHGKEKRPNGATRRHVPFVEKSLASLNGLCIESPFEPLGVQLPLAQSKVYSIFAL